MIKLIIPKGVRVPVKQLSHINSFIVKKIELQKLKQPKANLANLFKLKKIFFQIVFLMNF